MNQFIIRPAQMRDLPTLLEFEQALVESERPFDETLRPGTIHYYDLEEMIRRQDTHVVVAESGQVVIASGHARILEGKAYNTFERYAFLGFMYTKPAFRGQGVNRMIIDALVEWAKSKDLREVRLQVYQDNAPAIKAYQKAGFVKMLVEMRIEVSDRQQGQ